MSNVFNYQSILNNEFTEYLKGTNTSSKTQTNYKSDLRHFFSWLEEIFNKQSNIFTSFSQLLTAITSSTIGLYKQSMIESNTPSASINRRLSSVRTFFKFALSQNWITLNPADKVTNTTPDPNQPLTRIQILGEFEKSLTAEGSATTTVRSYISDVDQFLLWLESQAAK